MGGAVLRPLSPCGLHARIMPGQSLADKRGESGSGSPPRRFRTDGASGRRKTSHSMQVCPPVDKNGTNGNMARTRTRCAREHGANGNMTAMGAWREAFWAPSGYPLDTRHSLAAQRVAAAMLCSAEKRCGQVALCGWSETPDREMLRAVVEGEGASACGPVVLERPLAQQAPAVAAGVKVCFAVV